MSDPISEPVTKSWTPEAYPAVPPDAKFRQDLQRALEQTHRQQMAQRKVGATSAARPQFSIQRVAGLLLLLLALLLALRWFLNHDSHD